MPIRFTVYSQRRTKISSVLSSYSRGFEIDGKDIRSLVIERKLAERLLLQPVKRASSLVTMIVVTKMISSQESIPDDEGEVDDQIAQEMQNWCEEVKERRLRLLEKVPVVELDSWLQFTKWNAV